MSTKKINVTQTITKRFCDFCGKMEDYYEKVCMNTCAYCGKDVCNWCISDIPIDDPEAYVDHVYPCPACKDLDIKYLHDVWAEQVKKEQN